VGGKPVGHPHNNIVVNASNTHTWVNTGDNCTQVWWRRVLIDSRSGVRAMLGGVKRASVALEATGGGQEIHSWLP
jgi:hypothetical protein